MQIYTPKNAYPNSTARLAVIFGTRVFKQYFCVEKHVFMERNDNKRQVARTLFVHGKMTQKEIANKLEVTEQTISRWAKKDHWDELKRNIITGKQEILRSLYAELEKLHSSIKGFADSKTADIRRKLITDIRQLETQYSISEAVQIGIDFCEFLKIIDKDFAVKVNDYYRAFINEQLEKQKWQK